MDLEQVRVEHAPPNDKLYGNPLLGVQATGGSTAIRAAWKPMREAGATARTMLVAAAAKRWNVDPASCRAQGGEVSTRRPGESLAYGELAADAARMPVPQNVALKRPEEFKLIGNRREASRRIGKVDGTAVYGIDVRLPGMKIATLAQSPDLRRPGQARRRCRRQVCRRRASDRATRRCGRRRGRPHGSCEQGTRGACNRVGRRPARRAQDGRHRGASSKRRRSSSGPVAQNIGDVERAMAGAAAKVDAIYQVPFLAHAAMEPMNCTVHRSQGQLRSLGRQSGHRKRPGRRGEDSRPAAGQGPGPQSSDRRRLRAAAGSRRRRPRRPDRAACRRPGQGRLDPRGGHPARHVPALLVRQALRRSRRERESRSPGATVLQDRRSSRDGCLRRSRMASIPTAPKARSIWSMRFRTCTSNMCGWSRPAFRPPSGAASGRRTMSS